MDDNVKSLGKIGNIVLGIMQLPAGIICFWLLLFSVILACVDDWRLFDWVFNIRIKDVETFNQMHSFREKL